MGGEDMELTLVEKLESGTLDIRAELNRLAFDLSLSQDHMERGNEHLGGSYYKSWRERESRIVELFDYLRRAAKL